jgi:predicted Zn-dependent protease
MVVDHNICPACARRAPLDAVRCPSCGEQLLLPARGALSVFQLGSVPEPVLRGLRRNLARRFHRPVVVQPALVDPRPSARPRWRGRSASVFLRQIESRKRRGGFATVGLSADNIVPAADWNYVFGLGRMHGRAAVVSLHMLSRDGRPDVATIIDRATKVAVHEVGHGLGLGHHSYVDGVRCVMVGDVERDCCDTLDAGTASFCASCGRRCPRSRRPSR